MPLAQAENWTMLYMKNSVSNPTGGIILSNWERNPENHQGKWRRDGRLAGAKLVKFDTDVFRGTIGSEQSPHSIGVDNEAFL
jgi:hypothetical protein